MAVILGCAAFFYLGGMLGQLFSNYAAWMQADGLAGEAAMKPVSWNLWCASRWRLPQTG